MINHIELAKECGASNAPTNSFMVNRLDAVVLTHDQLAAFTNAIIEQCANVADNRQKQVGDSTNEFLILALKIRALKLKE